MNSRHEGLNEAQLRAVHHPPDIPLQILAGPGSGKTRVLATRIAHLVAEHGIPPAAICAVTFTNKAANEMKERLSRLMGREQVSLMKLGTFHSLCARLVRKHAALLSIESNFTVCDADESKKIVTKLLKPFKDILSAREITLTAGTVVSRISKAKAKGHSSRDLLDDCLGSTSKGRSDKGKGKGKATQFDEDDDWDDCCDGIETLNPLEVIATIVARIYHKYQSILRDNNSLDFDDLLIYGVKLFKGHPHVAKWCQHILVDEFQDTNTMQYELMRCIASAHRCLTVVGDPDQSIYGWRSAEVENLARMKRDFASTQQILLEQNYRSTGAILGVSVAIVEQDKSRIPKTLHTTHQSGPKPVLRCFATAEAEGSAIATEVKRVIACTGGMLAHQDFAILLRYNALSRVFESALQREGIPSKILGGHRFFERLEVKDLLAYLQVIDNPSFVPAFTRVINVPARNIGEKTINELIATATRLRVTPLDVVERIHAGRIPDIKPPVKRKLVRFVPVMKKLRKLADAHETPASLIRELLSLIEYEEHLKKTQQDWESRWENVQELINFASELEADLISSTTESPLADGSEGDDWGDVIEDEYEEDELDDFGFAEIKRGETQKPMAESVTPLRAFLQTTMLCTDVETDETEEHKKKERVTISTCHAAKGLEWPIVFVPAVEKGIFPASRAEDTEEERRLLYVACTRAQCLLYLTHATSRMKSGENMKNDLSEFVVPLLARADILVANDQPPLDRAALSLFATVLNRHVPQQADVDKRLTELRMMGKPLTWAQSFSAVGATPEDPTPHATYGNSTRGASANSYSSLTDDGTDAPVSFVSAKSTLHLVRRGPDPQLHKTLPLSPSRKDGNRPQIPVKGVTKGDQPAVLDVGTRPMTSNQKKPLSAKGTLTAWLRPSADSSSATESTKSPPAEPMPMGRSSLPKSQLSYGSSHPKPTVRTSRVLPPVSAIPPFKSLAPHISSENLASQENQARPALPAAVVPSGTKRRLGMGRTVVGYPSKKFKAPA